MTGDDARESAGLEPAAHQAAVVRLYLLVDDWPGPVVDVEP